MNKIKRIKINSKTVRFRTVSETEPGLMSPNDKILLDALLVSSESPSETNITLDGPSTAEIKSELNDISNSLDNYSEKLTDIEERLIYVESIYCGRVWDESNSSPTAKTYCGSLEMLQKLPEILGLGGYLVQNDHTRRKLSKETHYKFATGEEAKLDGSMGHYQWGWNRPFYITTWKEGNLFYECVSLEPIKSKESYYVPVGSMSASGHAAIDREENRLVSYCNTTARYRGGINKAELDEDEEKTLLGRCATYKTTAAFTEAAHKNGKGWYAGTMRMYNVLTILFHIIMGTRNSQAEFNLVKNSDSLYECGLGAGVTNLFDSNWSIWTTYNQNNPFLSMEELVDLGDFTGVSDTREITYKNASNVDTTKTYTIPVFFGLKNPFGYLWRLFEDEFGKPNDTDKGMVHYIRKSLYSEDYVYGTINDAVLEGGTTPTGEVWIKELSYENLEMWPIVCSSGASANGYYCDLLYYSNYSISNIRNIIRGGISHIGPDSGLSFIHINYNTTDYNGAFCTFLCEFTEDFLLEPVVAK